MTEFTQDKWLFHYTNADALLNILKDGALWGSDANYLNDYKEIQLGIEYANYWINQHKSELQNKYGKNTVTQLLNNTVPHPNNQSGQQMFVCSFSTEKDSLTQWRTYASGSGYSLGINRQYLENKANQLGLTLQKCIYEHDEKNNPIVNYLSHLNENNAFTDIDNPENNKLLNICNYIKQYSMILKGKEFKQESEWRLFPDFNFPYKSAIEFRVRNGVFIPYVKLKLFPETDNEKMIKTSVNTSTPVLEVMVGPSPHQDLAHMSLRRLLKEYRSKYRFLSPQLSKATYRDW